MTIALNKEEKGVFKDLFYRCGAAITADHFGATDQQVYAYAARHHMFTRQRESYLNNILDGVVKELGPDTRYTIEHGSNLHRIIIASMNDVIRRSKSKKDVIPD